MSFYIVAFSELSTERHQGLGLSSIPRSAIVDYAGQYDLDFEEFKYIIRQMDAHYLMIVEKKADG